MFYIPIDFVTSITAPVKCIHAHINTAMTNAQITAKTAVKNKRQDHEHPRLPEKALINQKLAKPLTDPKAWRSLPLPDV